MYQWIEKLRRNEMWLYLLIFFAGLIFCLAVVLGIAKIIMVVGGDEPRQTYVAAVSAAAIVVSATAAIVGFTLTLRQMGINRKTRKQEDAHELIRKWNDAYTSHIKHVTPLFNEYLSKYGERKDAQCQQCVQVQICKREVDALFCASSRDPGTLNPEELKYYYAAYALEHIFNYFSLIADAYERRTADRDTIKETVSMNMVRWYDIFQLYIHRVNAERYPTKRGGPWVAFANLAAKWKNKPPKVKQESTETESEG